MSWRVEDSSFIYIENINKRLANNVNHTNVGNHEIHIIDTMFQNHTFKRGEKIGAFFPDFVDYEIWLGSFEGDKFVWKTIKKFNDFDKAYKFYNDYVDKQESYTAEELQKIWSSPRIDIELRQGKKLLNWVGMYNRKVGEIEEDEQEKTEDALDEEHQDMLRDVIMEK